ncbi:MAG TPA: molybdopterin cofactor-binding domain-containing protein [Ktedonobacteraceae bacterium]|nr:molybdopterin cofactor-binding domain-containing protein [Ktedonobacteraceae bacterium]
MELELSINGVIESLDVAPNESLLSMLRREGYYSVKHGCETGECGACTVLVDGVPRPACVTLATQTGGCTLTTVESLGNARTLHPLQEAFIDTGAVQCGFCTSGMLLSAAALLKQNPSPSEEEVREALSGNLCRCTGYAKPVQAVLRAAALMRGEAVQPVSSPASDRAFQPWKPEAPSEIQTPSATPGEAARTNELSVVGRSERKIDAIKLVTGKPAFTDDINMRGMLYARLLTSPHAHAIIREIDVSEARALPGVHAILTYKDVPRLAYNSAGQSWPEGGPHDQYVLDERVRFVGDRVAVVAAETIEAAEQALKLIKVEYEILPAVFDLRMSTSSQAPRLHLAEDSSGVSDPAHNVAAQVQAQVGDVERGFAQSDLVIEGEYLVPQVQQAPIENHVAVTCWDEDRRLVVRSNTAAAYHVRRILSSLTGLPPRRIRVLRPGVGGNFGAKQDLVIEDLCALLTLATDRPIRLEYSRTEEFTSSRSRHAQIIRMKTGVKRDGTIVANSMKVLANTGAYGAHALAVQSNTGAQTLPIYPCPNMYFEARVVYTNLPPAGAFRGYGAPQGFFALESHIDEIARQLDMDALDLRRKNWIKEGDEIRLVRELSATKENIERIVRSCGLPECLRIVGEGLHWKEKRGKQSGDRFQKGVGIAIAMHGPTLIGPAMASAMLKLNEDGSFNLLVGTGDGSSDTLIAQITAEVLGVQIEDIILQPLDTDTTPFNADVTSSVYSSGGAALKAAEQVREQLLEVAGRMLKSTPGQLNIKDGRISSSDGRSITVSQVALQSLYGENRHQIMAIASWMSTLAPASFGAQGAEVEIDTETGVVRVLKCISAIDAGRAINRVIAEGQIEGAVAQALGYAVSEELLYDQRGNMLTTDLSSYRIFNAPDMPVLETHLVETSEPGGPYGAKDAEEVAIDAMAAAIANAVADALGVRVRQLPLTPERVLRILRAQAQSHNG